MQRLFSAFPGGWPGAGLLLLRVVLGITVCTHGVFCFMASSNSSPASIALGLVLAMAGLGILVGFLTPVSCLLTALITGGTVASLFPRPSPDLIGSGLPAILTSCIAVALVFLGPGALSLDAKRFGRRAIDIPMSQSRPPES